MICQCKKCGNWFESEETKVCQECGESEEIEKFDDSELIEILNDYEWLRQNLKVVEDGENVKIESKFGTQTKGEFTGKFITLCKMVDYTKKITNDLFKVIDIETKEQLFVGTKEECGEYAKNHETIWKELAIKEWYKK